MKSDVAFAAWFVFCAIVGLGLLAVGVWGFIELVQWVIVQ